MTPAAAILEPHSDPALYVAAVLTLYVDLPDTPLRASVPDQRQARIWFDRGVPLEAVETALLLACLRRTVRPTDAPPLPRIRSLAYFQPVIEELRRDFQRQPVQSIENGVLPLRSHVPLGAPLAQLTKRASHAE